MVGNNVYGSLLSKDRDTYQSLCGKKEALCGSFH
jgi:hypothetical protein